MKTRLPFFVGAASILAVGVWFGTATKLPAIAEKPAAPRAPAAAPDTNLVVPESVFVFPRNYQEGRDPFFPNADLGIRYGDKAPVKPPTEQNDVVLVVNGHGGTSESPLVMINNYTLGPGDTHEFNIKGNRVKVKCIEIKSTSVIVEYGGKQEELSFPGN